MVIFISFFFSWESGQVWIGRRSWDWFDTRRDDTRVVLFHVISLTRKIALYLSVVFVERTRMLLGNSVFVKRFSFVLNQALTSIKIVVVVIAIATVLCKFLVSLLWNWYVILGWHFFKDLGGASFESPFLLSKLSSATIAAVDNDFLQCLVWHYSFLFCLCVGV